MKMVKSLLLGSAAGLVAVAGAQAADLPVKAKAVEYVKVCAAYGAGYYYIPGTDTCLKIGGYARADFYGNARGTFNPYIQGADYNSTTNALNTRARAVMDMDARTQTEYGTLRSYIRFGAEWNSNNSAPGFANYTGNGSNAVYIERAFIQFAGLTAGYTSSFFDSGVNYMLTTPYAKSDRWTTLLGYTAEFGNGFSASVSLEDAVNRITAPANAYNNGLGDAQGGTQVPDIVGNLRLAQSWGTLMVSGAAHQSQIADGLAFPALSTSSDKWGWAIQGFAQFNLPFLAAGDSIFFTASYADGAINYLGMAGTSQGVSNAVGRLNDFTRYRLSDVVATDLLGNYDTTSGWALSGQFRHFWTPGLRSALYAGYVSIDAPETVTSLNNGFADFDFWQVGANTIWSPVKNLDIGAEILYSKVDGSRNWNGTVGGSTDVWSGGLRVQRNF